MGAQRRSIRGSGREGVVRIAGRGEADRSRHGAGVAGCARPPVPEEAVGAEEDQAQGDEKVDVDVDVERKGDEVGDGSAAEPFYRVGGGAPAIIPTAQLGRAGVSGARVADVDAEDEERGGDDGGATAAAAEQHVATGHLQGRQHVPQAEDDGRADGRPQLASTLRQLAPEDPRKAVSSGAPWPAARR
jgi:hypothetical protein